MTQTPLLKRIRAEYLEMPGLRVSLPQAQRLFGLDRTLCKMVFDALVAEHFLCINQRGLYGRLPSMARSSAIAPALRVPAP